MNSASFRKIAVGLCALLLLQAVSLWPVAGEDRAVTNLRAFSKLYGYVRYFHPSDEAASIDWEAFAVYGAREVKKAAGDDQLKETLERLFLPIAPTLQILRQGEAPQPLELPKNTEGLKVVAWQHEGLWLGNPSGVFTSVRINRENKKPAGFSLFPASIGHAIDAAPFRGKVIRLSAHLRADNLGPGGHGVLWLQTEEKKEKGKENTVITGYERTPPYKIAKWKQVQLETTVNETAEKLTFGFSLSGGGSVWADDFVLEVKDGENKWTAVPLVNPGFEDVSKGEADELFAPWKPVVAAMPGREQPKGVIHFKTSGDNPISGKKCAFIGSKYIDMEHENFDKHPLPGEYVDKKLGGTLSCRLPLALYSDDKGTLGKTSSYPLADLTGALAAENKEYPVHDEAMRLGCVVIGWNIFQHFYPYFDVVNTDWDAQLTLSLREASAAAGEEEFHHVLLRMVEALGDCHGRVSSMGAAQGVKKQPVPILFDWIEDRLVAVRSLNELVKRGDVVLEVDGKPVEERIKDEETRISGSPQWKRVWSTMRVSVGPADAPARLKILRDGQALELEVKRGYKGNYRFMREFERPSIKRYEDGVFYVDLDRATMPEIEKRMQEIAKAPGVVFDLRGYPKGNHRVISHLLTKAENAKWMKIPKFIYPDREKLAGYLGIGWDMGPAEPHINGKVVFIINGRAVSYAESFMGYIEGHKLAEIVGSPTAGANGNVNPFSLPGDYRISWTGMKVTKHDGSQHHLIGVLPTIPVKRTIKGVAEGRDEFLEKALEVARSAEGKKRK